MLHLTTAEFSYKQQPCSWQYPGGQRELGKESSLGPAHSPPWHNDGNSKITSKGVCPRVPKVTSKESCPEQEIAVQGQWRAEVLYEALGIKEKIGGILPYFKNKNTEGVIL